MKLAVVVGGSCGVCHVAPHEHARCAVCEGSNQLVRLCAHCHAWNKAQGVAWNDKRLDTDDPSGELGEELERTVPRPLRDAMTPTRRRGRPRDARIDDAVIPRLLRRRVRVKVPRFDQYGRSRGTYEIWDWPSRRQIAREARCSHASVDRRYNDYTRNSRASYARPIT